MPANAGKLAALIAVALLGVLAATTRQSAFAESGPLCRAKVSFANVAYVQNGSLTGYQFRTIIDLTTDTRHTTVWGKAWLSGYAGNQPELQVPDLHPGHNVYVRWLSPDSNDKSRYERLHLEIECDGETDGAGTEIDVKARVYRPGERQPLIQPWTDQCPSSVVIDSRGSSTADTRGRLSAPGAAFLNRLRLDRVKAWDDSIVYSLSNPYPAKGGLLAFLEAKAKLPLAYHRSVVAGKKWLRKELGLIAQRCPRTGIWLIGYSQGAQVTGDVYQEKKWPHVAGVVLFGDPSFNGKDISDRGDYQSGLSGSLHERKPFNSGWVRSYCHRFDPVCQGILAYALKYQFKYHNYTARGEPEEAADFFAEHA